jgi:acyl dehydratase
MALKASELTVGDSYEEEVCRDLSRTQIVQYAGTSGDYNPLHTDDKYTTEIAKYPSVFAHGMLSMGMTGKMLTNYVGDGRLRSFGVRFTAQVFPGATLTATATVAAIRDEDGESIADIEVSTVDEAGTVGVKGQATALLDA